MRISFRVATDTAKKMIDKECDARTQAESDAEWLRGELEAERRLRLNAEYDRELYAMQLAEHSTDDMNQD